MNDLHLFLPCAAGVQDYLAQEVALILGAAVPIAAQTGGVALKASWRQAMQLNLHSRLASRVLIGLMQRPYRSEADIYEAACDVPWEDWFKPSQSFKIDITASKSPLRSLNFAALRVKDAICDRFRHQTGMRPSVDTQRPDVRIFVHLSQSDVSIYVDTSGEPLFKRGWRHDKGDAPLKETLAAAMLAASGWWSLDGQPSTQALYDPCCGSGTIAIEAAQIACGIAAGVARPFAFERLLAFAPQTWQAIHAPALEAKAQARQRRVQELAIFGSDVAHRMVDFAQRNAQLAGVADCVQWRGGDALQRQPPCAVPPQGAMILTNPPYGERIAIAGLAKHETPQPARRRQGSAAGLSGEAARPWLAREQAQIGAARGGGLRGNKGDERGYESGDDAGYEDGFGDGSGEGHRHEQGEASGDSNFFAQLAAHWKTHFDGWSAWLLVPDMKLPGKMRLKESRRIPLWNGPIECRLFRFDIQARSGPGS